MWHWNRTTGLWPPFSHILLYLLNAHLLEEESSLLGDNFQPQLPHYKASESDHFCLCFLQEPGASVSPPLTARDPLSGRTGYNKDGGMSPLCPVNGPPLTNAGCVLIQNWELLLRIVPNLQWLREGMTWCIFSSANFNMHDAGMSFILVYILEAKVVSESTTAEQQQTSVTTSKSVLHSQ